MKEVMPPIPEEFVVKMVEQFGEEEGRALVASLDTPPSVSLRINGRKQARHSLEPLSLYEGMESVAWAEGGYRLAERPRFTFNPLLHAGAFYVQEAASMYLSRLVREYLPATPLRVLDLCAAPGGKSISALESLADGSLMVSNEVMRPRASVLAENICKWGYPDRVVTSGSAAAYGRMEGFFDLLIVDAPCSGEGMMRKESVARTQWNPGLVDSCAALQREILRDALPALRPGGWLVYSTCTFNSEEDERNVEWLESRGYRLLETPRRFTPHRDGTEGLFMAIFRKEVAEEGAGSELAVIEDSCRDFSRGGGKGKGNRNGKDVGVGKEMIRVAEGWLADRAGYRVVAEGTRLRALSGDVEEFLRRLPSGVKVLSAGVEVGEIKGKDLVPAHPLVVSTLLRDGAFPRVELDEEESLRYLRRESVVMPAGTPVGYVVVTYKGYPLGLVKNLGNRANNLYPKEWRILTSL